jgi:hypothetical protein
MKRPGIAILHVFVCAAFVVGNPAHAEKGNEIESVAALKTLAQCRTISDDVERLACFDRETASLIAATESGDVRIVDREDVKAVRRGLFGFQLPRVGLFGNGDKDGEEIEADRQLDTTITSVTTLTRGHIRFTIAEGGAIWQTTEASSRVRTPRVGEKVQIERAALGSYWIRFGNQIGVKGRRVE